MNQRERNGALRRVGGALAVALCAQTSASAISVSPSGDAGALTGTILGPGITLVGAPTYTGAASASGTFTGGLASGIGIDSGIILTTGDASLAEGPNSADDTGVNNFLAGSSDLDPLASFDTFDASILEFEFTTAGGDLFFNYVFASEEYNEFSNTAFNDVFAFFLDGANIALVPGTTDPVAIDTVNGGNPLGTDAKNPALFNNNDLEDGGPFFDIEYDGFTDVFTAMALGLSPGTHTISLQIADSSDEILDSAVFIQAGSFSDIPSDPLPDASPWIPAAMALLGAVWVSRHRVGLSE